MCSNCNGPAGPLSLRLTLGGDNLSPAVAEICEKCQHGTLTVKLVLSREKAKDQFKYEQWLAVANEK